MKKSIITINLFIVIFTFALGREQYNTVPDYKNNRYLHKLTSGNSVRICALRVSFAADDNQATTGDGHFLSEDGYDSPCSDFEVDPPPHNRAYFKDHIRSLSNYYNHVSHGNAIIDTNNSEVFPLSDELTYQVSQTMDYYHPFLDEDSIDARLVALFKESVKEADKDIDVVFSDYDVVVVFHAGVGQDFSIMLDPTPYDIPSAYLNINDFRRHLGNGNPKYQGIEIDGIYLSQGLILPETQNHILYDNWENVFGGTDSPCVYQIGLNGTFAFMMGFYWGLPSLYDTDTGETGIGKFGLMDQGSSNLNGLSPAVPCAWERVFLGWEEPIAAKADEKIELGHVELGTDSLVWMVPVNDNEYFLVENRNAEIRPGVSFDSLQYRLYLESGEEEWPLIFPLIKDSLNGQFSDETGVLLSLPRYDLGLPGSGLLIWHIDESVIDVNYYTNTVNVNRDRRGVDLEEADGAQDMGYKSQIFGADVTMGWYFDPWFAGNEGFFHMNPDYATDEEERIGFNDFTNPSSMSNSYSYTGISIDSIGGTSEIMNFRISREHAFDKYPVFLSGSSAGLNLNPYSFDIDEDGFEEIVVILDSVYIFKSDGKLINKIQLSAETDSVISTELAFCEQDNNVELYVVDIRINSSICISHYDIYSDGEALLQNRVVMDDAGTIANLIALNDGFLTSSKNVSGSHYLIKYSSEDEELLTAVIEDGLLQLAGDDESVFAVTENGKLVQIDPSSLGITHINETVLTESQPGVEYASIVAGYLNDNSSRDLVVCHNGSLVSVLDIFTDFETVYNVSVDTLLMHPILSDIDNDGKVEILLNSGTKIYAYNRELILENNFPIFVPNTFKDRLFEPYLFTHDLDDDGELEIVSTISDIGVIVFNSSDDICEGFPIAVDNHYNLQKMLINSEEGTMYIGITGIQDGYQSLDALLLSENHLDDESWYSYGGGNRRDFLYNIHSEPIVTDARSLLNKNKTYNWPNPVKGSRTKMRYYPNKECNISIDIYDLSGDFVESFSDNDPVIGDYNEIDWNVGNVESGVYFAVVKATSGNTSESKIVKVMVIK